MIVIPCPVARSCRSVFRRLLTSRKAYKAASIGLIAGSHGLLVRLATEPAVIEYLHPTACPEMAVALPLDALRACEGRSGAARVIPLAGNRAEVRWTRAGAEHSRMHRCDGRVVPTFPLLPGSTCVNGPELLVALDRASQMTSNQSVRYATDHVQLRGTQGEVIGTDGRQLLVQRGFRFPFADDVLVPASTLFAARELHTGESVAVGRSGDYLVLASGRWTMAWRVNPEGWFPNVANVIPTEQAIKTLWYVFPQDARAIKGTLAKAARGSRETIAVTLDLDPKHVTIRFKVNEEGPVTELALPDSRIEGERGCVVLGHYQLVRALQLGFTTIQFGRPHQPALCRDGQLTYVCTTLTADVALPRHPDVIQSPAAHEAAEAESPPPPSRHEETCPLPGIRS